MLVLVGLGVGCVMPNLTTAIQNAVSRADLGVATSAAAFFRALGGALGVAVSGTLLTTGLAHMLPVATGVSGGGSMGAIASLPPAQHLLVVEAYRHALSLVFLASAGIAALGFALVVFLPERPLRSVPASGD
jgi:hypothetical protein